MTSARVLLVLLGFVAVVVGLVELGPDARPAARTIGLALVGLGLLSWVLVALLARPRPSRAVPVTVALLAVLTAAALVVSLVPADLPASANTSGLENDQSPTTPPEPAATGYVPATDGTPLAYFADVPRDPVATLVFYHGSGANAGAGYLDFARRLAERYHVATYLFDLRGHGRSGGRRGDAPSQRQVFTDTQTAVDFVHGTHPRLPEYVGGHSAGAGVVLNSEDLIGHEVAGYVYLAPDFGLHSGTERQSEGSNFVRISHRVLIADVVTNGLLDAHAHAVSFAYTPEEISRAGLVSRYTSTMAIAQNAAGSAAILAGTPQPVGVWIGSDDEVFDAGRVLAWARQAPRATTGTVPGANHLGVIDRSVSDVGLWIDRQAAR